MLAAWQNCVARQETTLLSMLRRLKAAHNLC